MIKNILYAITHWETWHWTIKYLPIMPFWFWYCLRSRSVWFFTTSNPTITFGGFYGETKREIYKQLPSHLYPKSTYITPSDAFADVVHKLTERKLQFPLAVKPDIGMMGFMFRKLDSIDQLKQYHNTMPADYIVQDLVSYPVEVSVFYFRLPGEKSGKITGFLKKEQLHVTGDGKHTLGELMQQHPGVRFRLREMREKHRSRLDKIIPAGESYCLLHALNLSRGGRFVSLEHEIDEQLTNVFDDLSHYTTDFYYGRYDIKCASVDDLKAGQNFKILEYNGCGSEPHHIYGSGKSLLEACYTLVKHWKILYRISKINKERGFSVWTFRRGLTFMRSAWRYFSKLSALDVSFEVERSVAEIDYEKKVA